MDNNKFYVFWVGYEGLCGEDFKEELTDSCFDTLEEAEERVNELLDNWVDEEDEVYIWHDGKIHFAF